MCESSASVKACGCECFESFKHGNDCKRNLEIGKEIPSEFIGKSKKEIFLPVHLCTDCFLCTHVQNIGKHDPKTLNPRYRFLLLNSSCKISLSYSLKLF